MSIRTLIIDDEFLARERLKKLLAPYPELVVAGECRNGKEALDMIVLKSPDLVFLDVQMPAMNGLELVQQLQLRKIELPLIVFTTAHDHYALKAFEAAAIDYLLKPFEKDRFKHTVERIRSQFQLQQSLDLNLKMRQLLQSFSSQPSSYRQSFQIKAKGRSHTIACDDILYIHAEGNYLKLVGLNKNWMYRAPIGQLIDELDPKEFFRIHRSIILNLRYLDAYRYQGNNEYCFKMKNGTELMSSRSYKTAIVERLDLAS